MGDYYPDIDALPETVTENPTHIWIEPTDRCNTRCTHCGHYYERFGQDMDEKLYHKISGSVLDGVKVAELIGYGEPLIAKHFQRMFDECVEREIEIFTTSNGIKLRKDEIVAKIVRNNVTLCLSIDGARAETLEFVRPYIKWEQMLKTLECIKRNADQAGDEKKFRLRFNFVAMKQNISDLPDLVRLANQYGAFQIYILPLGGEENFEKVMGQSLFHQPDLISEPYIKALKLANQLNVEIIAPPSFKNSVISSNNKSGISGKLSQINRKLELAGNYIRQNGIGATFQRFIEGKPPAAKAGVTFCTKPWKDSYFASDGTVYPCCLMTENLGNMKEQEWQEIWNGPLYKHLRRTTHSWNPTKVCRQCNLPDGINGGDERFYEKYFSRFQSKNIPLDSPDVKYIDGFYQLEYEDDEVHHVWMGQKSKLEIPLIKGAKFLRFIVSVKHPVNELNPGRLRINQGEWEPFDNTCHDINFPVDHLSTDRITVDFEFEKVWEIPNDDRKLSFGIFKIYYLT